MPAVGEHLTAKPYVDIAISHSVHQSSLLRLDPDEKLNKQDEQNSTFLNSTVTSPKMIIEIPTKSFVDSLHEINRIRRDLSSVLNDQDNEFDNKKLTNLDSAAVKRDLSSDNEWANKKYVHDLVGSCNFFSI